MPATAERPIPKARCPRGCRWTFRRWSCAGSLGPVAHADKCEKCRDGRGQWYVLVHDVKMGRRGRVHVRRMAIEPLHGRDEGSLREALGRVEGLTETQRAVMIQTVRGQVAA